MAESNPGAATPPPADREPIPNQFQGSQIPGAIHLNIQSDQPTSPPPPPITPAPPAPQAPVTPTPQPVYSAPIAGEVIQGAPTRPGDKVEPTTTTTPPAATSATPAAMPPQGKRPNGQDLDNEEKLFSGIGYIGVLALLPLLGRRDSEFAQHHGRQALIIAIIFVFLYLITPISIALAVFVGILNLIVIIGGFLLALKGDWFRIPGIYEISLKLKMPKTPQQLDEEDEEKAYLEEEQN